MNRAIQANKKAADVETRQRLYKIYSNLFLGKQHAMRIVREFDRESV